jgi:ABC-type antimicrobial peptide transport system permease subunit
VAQLSTLFGAVAALLACIGIYGVMSYRIARRTNEFGIRMALGAQGGEVLWMVLRETLALVLVGAAIGLALALMVGRVVTVTLFGLSPTDPLTIGLATALITSVAIFAGWVPARRATQIDPTVACDTSKLVGNAERGGVRCSPGGYLAGAIDCPR